MWTTILSLVKSFFVAVAGVMDYLDAERMKKLGALEQEQLHIDEERRNQQIATEVDGRPTPRDKRVVLDGLRKQARPDA
jgi:hypothetical protein